MNFSQNETDLIRDIRKLEPDEKIIIIKDIIEPPNYYLIKKGQKILLSFDK